MSKRTSIPEILARFWMVAFFFALFPYGLVAVLGGAISFSFLAFIALVAILLFNGLQWVGHWAIFGRTAEYQEYRKSGGDPWFHMSCPPPFNCDSEQVRLLTGFRELYPTMGRLIEWVKRHDYKHLAHELQRIESSIVIDDACEVMRLQHPDVPILTIHDAILTTDPACRMT